MLSIGKYFLNGHLRPISSILYHRFHSQSSIDCKRCLTFQCLHRAVHMSVGVSNRAYSTQPTNTWEFDVKPFGKFTMRTGALASLFVKPIDPHIHPMQNKAFVKISEVDDGTDDATLTCTVENSEILLEAQHINPNADKKLFACDVELPIKFDLDVQVEGGRDVAVKDFENSSILVKTDQGSCYLFGIKSGTVDIQTLGGNVVSKSYLQANGTVTTCGLGCVLMDRVLGLDFDVQTEEGDIDIKAAYADQSKFYTDIGSVNLKSCHRNSQVNIEEMGNLTVGTLDGDMKATINHGDVDIFFTKHGQVDVQLHKGNMVLKMSDSTDTDIDLSGSKVTVVDSDLIFTPSQDGGKTDTALKGHIVHTSVSADDVDPLLGKRRTNITAHTGSGTISVECKDWLASLNLSHTTDLL